MFLINIPMAAINTGLNNFLSSLSGSSAVLLGLLVFGRDNLPRGVFRHATAQASCFPENTHV